ncbi:MAG TPA: DUF2993 domain-containing protein [Actinomycetota bacterium]|jgi:hypothetical protein
MMRKLWVVLGLVVFLLVSADVGLRLVAQYWVARAVQGSLGLDERPSVSLDGFPFLLRLATGDIPSVSVELDGSSTVEQLPIHDVSLSLRDVRFSPGDLVVGDRTTIRAEHGEGTMTMTEEDVNRALPATLPVTVRLEDGGVTVVAEGRTVRTRLLLSDGKLVLEPAQGSLPLSVSVRLPELVPGISYTGVRVDGATAVLTFTLENATFRIARA